MRVTEYNWRTLNVVASSDVIGPVLYRNVFGLRTSVRNANWNVMSSTASPSLSTMIS